MLAEGGLERVQDAGRAGGLDQELVDAVPGGEPGGGLAVHLEAGGGPAGGAVRGAQFPGGGVAFAVPGDHAPVPARGQPRPAPGPAGDGKLLIHPTTLPGTAGSIHCHGFS
jgi:hypothetical protein